MVRGDIRCRPVPTTASSAPVRTSTQAKPTGDGTESLNFLGMDRYNQILLADAVKREIKVKFSALEGACSVCRMLDQRVFDPKIAPTIPVRGCQSQACRCEYLPV